jgi:hypothetical protein
MKCPDCGAERLADPEFIKENTNATDYVCPLCKRPLLKQCSCGSLLDCYDLLCSFCGLMNPIRVLDNIEVREKTLLRILHD